MMVFIEQKQNNTVHLKNSFHSIRRLLNISKGIEREGREQNITDAGIT